MRIFVIVLVIATVVGGFVGGELTGMTFSITGAVVGGVSVGAVLLGLGAFFHAQEKKKRRATLTPEIRGVFDRMLARKAHAAPPSAQRISPRSSAQADPVQAALNALREIETEELPALPLIKRELVDLIRDREKTTISIVQESLHPKGLVFLLISNIAYRELSSGNHHVYRGVLSMNGTELKKAFDTAVRRMVVFRVHDKAECEAELVKIREAIASAG